MCYRIRLNLSILKIGTPLLTKHECISKRYINKKEQKNQSLNRYDNNNDDDDYSCDEVAIFDVIMASILLPTHTSVQHLNLLIRGWLGSRMVCVLDSGADRPGFKSQSRRCTVLYKLFKHIVPLFTKQQKW